MALFTKSQLYQRANSEIRLSTKSADQILKEKAKAVPLGTAFDIFLSHSSSDAPLILGLSLALQDMGYKVYVDWVVDSHLDRSEVTKETADLLRKRMGDCRSLFYASTDNTPLSKWMPWETGYFDAKKGKVAIVPVSTYGQPDDQYEGQEYLGLYPYASVRSTVGTKPVIVIHDGKNTYVFFEEWIQGMKPLKRHF